MPSYFAERISGFPQTKSLVTCLDFFFNRFVLKSVELCLTYSREAAHADCVTILNFYFVSLLLYCQHRW
jgi:hypothetical protein